MVKSCFLMKTLNIRAKNSQFKIVDPLKYLNFRKKKKYDFDGNWIIKMKINFFGAKIQTFLNNFWDIKLYNV